MNKLKQILLGVIAVFILCNSTIASWTPAEIKADTLLTVVNQIISASKTPDTTKDSIKSLFLECSLKNKDEITREACEIVLNKLTVKNIIGKDIQPAYSIKQYKLIEVVDWDTIKIQDNNWDIKSVRLIGIDAPESNTTRYGYIECFGESASYHLKEILEWNDYIQIEFDASQGSYDKYGRMLWYLILNGENINEQMIKDWYAFEYTYNLPYKYQEEFKKAESDARLSSRWLWESTTCNWKRGDIKNTKNKGSESYSNDSSKTSYKWSDGRTYIRWPRGWCYYINSKGNKSYVSRSLCSEQKEERPTSSYSDYSSSSSSYSSNYIRGPRGGCYYYTNSGRKQYVDRSLCN